MFCLKIGTQLRRTEFDKFPVDWNDHIGIARTTPGGGVPIDVREGIFVAPYQAKLDKEEVISATRMLKDNMASMHSKS